MLSSTKEPPGARPPRPSNRWAHPLQQRHHKARALNKATTRRALNKAATGRALATKHPPGTRSPDKATTRRAALSTKHPPGAVSTNPPLGALSTQLLPSRAYLHPPLLLANRYLFQSLLLSFCNDIPSDSLAPLSSLTPAHRCIPPLRLPRCLVSALLPSCLPNRLYSSCSVGILPSCGPCHIPCPTCGLRLICSCRPWQAILLGPPACSRSSAFAI